MGQDPSLRNNLATVHRYITTHNSDGKAIFSGSQPETLDPTPLPDGRAEFRLGFATHKFPIQLTGDPDLGFYADKLANPPGLNLSNGSVLRYVDMPPNSVSPMHRTVSLDYGIVLEGQISLILDSGESKVMEKGDCAIQRGTNHAWHNQHATEWARMVFILLPCFPIEIQNARLGENLGDMNGVPAST
ncbi:hypothetical protein P152DRAFT_492624 [Eremomyces bilateralis CBS 781.70]|uniref:Cupin type-2 domain-containing protein n=1 Tax=Eremomyces bilateralis CBS 781.70 TaxID=1392243 RepID=A0A6G1GEX3_9PEZI|nr:uncharacterized protein P152DRAFT_492624 [Eremomyces bilateralis CBS 781.70]KAF1816419.1 hypothetical protein P152DRAFT_492624 [Eremomyces bilateralis CBS 781.70]